MPEDTDGAYDVYEWRNGDLSLVSTGASDTDGAFYYGNDESGRNVYFATFDDLTWQDVDAVLDVYTARIDGGIPEPQPPVICQVLAGGCHADDDGTPIAPAVGSNRPGEGNGQVTRVTLAVAQPSAKARGRAARSGVLSLRVRSSAAGPVTALARARIKGRLRSIGSASQDFAQPGTATTMRIELGRAARQALRAGRRIGVQVIVSAPSARKRTIGLVLRRTGR